MTSSSKGLRLLKAMEMIKSKPSFDAFVINKTKLLSSSDGVLKGSFKVEPAMCNLAGTVHGGYLTSVMDVFSFYSQLSNPDGRVCWTTAMNITYIHVAKEGETVNVESKPLKTGNTTIVETSFHNAAGNLLAKGTTSFVSCPDSLQHGFKDLVNFDVYEK